MGSHSLLEDDPPDSGIKPGSSALQADSLPSEPPGKACVSIYREREHYLHTKCLEIYRQGGLHSFKGIGEGTLNIVPISASLQSLGWEDPLGTGTATHSSILALGIP